MARAAYSFAIMDVHTFHPVFIAFLFFVTSQWKPFQAYGMRFLSWPWHQKTAGVKFFFNVFEWKSRLHEGGDDGQWPLKFLNAKPVEKWQQMSDTFVIPKRSKGPILVIIAGLAQPTRDTYVNLNWGKSSTPAILAGAWPRIRIFSAIQRK